MNVRDMHLRTKLAISMMGLVVVLTFPLIVIVEYRERKAIEEQVQNRGMTIADTLAALSTNALLVYNYVALEENVKRLARARDVAYVIILDREERVAAHSARPDLLGQQLTDPLHRRAVEAREPLDQVGADPRDPRGRDTIVEVGVPVFPIAEGHKYGTVRVGLSLQGMHQEIRRTRLTLAILGGTMALLGCLAALATARRLMAPLEPLGIR